MKYKEKTDRWKKARDIAVALALVFVLSVIIVDSFGEYNLEGVDITGEAANVENINSELESISERNIINTVGGLRAFKPSENPKFEFSYNANEVSSITGAAIGSLKLDNISAKVYYANKVVADIEPDIKIQDNGNFLVSLNKSRAFRAGKYSLEVQVTQGSQVFSSEQDFTWGVLAINTHKSIYSVNEKAFVGIGVLDDYGHMVCDADVTLEILNPNQQKTILTTEKGDIIVSPECAVYGITEFPDYYTYYNVSGVGVYSINLTAVTNNGVRSVTDSFLVENPPDFDVTRDGPTRIYPFVPYTMNFTIKANKEYSGPIIEYVPESFVITPQDGLTVTTIGDTKQLRWDSNLINGDVLNLAYEFDAPDISPEFYLLGELNIGGWNEYRTWQIASDVDSLTWTFNPDPLDSATPVSGELVIQADASCAGSGAASGCQGYMYLTDSGNKIKTTCGSNTWRISGRAYEIGTCNSIGGKGTYQGWYDCDRGESGSINFTLEACKESLTGPTIATVTTELNGGTPTEDSASNVSTYISSSMWYDLFLDESIASDSNISQYYRVDFNRKRDYVILDANFTDWSDPVQTTDQRGDRVTLAGPNEGGTIVRNSTGTLIAALNTYAPSNNLGDIDILVSNDNGNTWTVIATNVATDDGVNWALAINSTDDLHLTFRDNANSDFGYLVSVDGGYTWTDHRTELSVYTNYVYGTNSVIDDEDNIFFFWADYDGLYWDSKLQWKNASGWDSLMIDNAASGNGNRQQSIGHQTIDDRVYMIWRDRILERVEYASFNKTTWSIDESSVSAFDSSASQEHAGAIVQNSTGSIFLTAQNLTTTGNLGGINLVKRTGASTFSEVGVMKDCTGTRCTLNQLLIDAKDNIHALYANYTTPSSSYANYQFRIISYNGTDFINDYVIYEAPDLVWQPWQLRAQNVDEDNQLFLFYRNNSGSGTNNETLMIKNKYFPVGNFTTVAITPASLGAWSNVTWDATFDFPGEIINITLLNGGTNAEIKSNLTDMNNNLGVWDISDVTTGNTSLKLRFEFISNQTIQTTPQLDSIGLAWDASTVGTLVADGNFTTAPPIYEYRSIDFNANCSCSGGDCAGVDLVLQNSSSGSDPWSNTPTAVGEIYSNTTLYNAGTITSGSAYNAIFNITATKDGTYYFKSYCNSTDAVESNGTAEDLLVNNPALTAVNNTFTSSAIVVNSEYTELYGNCTAAGTANGVNIIVQNSSNADGPFTNTPTITSDIYANVSSYLIGTLTDSTSATKSFNVTSTSIGTYYVRLQCNATDTTPLTLNTSAEQLTVSTQVYNDRIESQFFMGRNLGASSFGSLSSALSFSGSQSIFENKTSEVYGNCSVSTATVNGINIILQNSTDDITFSNTPSPGPTSGVYSNITSYNIGTLNSGQTSSNYAFNITGITNDTYYFRAQCNSSDASPSTAESSSSALSVNSPQLTDVSGSFNPDANIYIEELGSWVANCTLTGPAKNVQIAIQNGSDILGWSFTPTSMGGNDIYVSSPTSNPTNPADFEDALASENFLVKATSVGSYTFRTYCNASNTLPLFENSSSETLVVVNRSVISDGSVTGLSTVFENRTTVWEASCICGSESGSCEGVNAILQNSSDNSAWSDIPNYYTDGVYANVTSYLNGTLGDGSTFNAYFNVTGVTNGTYYLRTQCNGTNVYPATDNSASSTFYVNTPLLSTAASFSGSNSIYIDQTSDFYGNCTVSGDATGVNIILQNGSGDSWSITPTSGSSGVRANVSSYLILGTLSDQTSSDYSFNITGVESGTYNFRTQCNASTNTAPSVANSTSSALTVNAKSISIGLSGFNNGIVWSIDTLPVDNANATGNANATDDTNYTVSISASGTNVDVYIKANDSLKSGTDIIELGNETFTNSTTTSKVPFLGQRVITTTYQLIADNTADGSYVWLRFFLDAPGAQPVGTYRNNISIKGVEYGASP